MRVPDYDKMREMLAESEADSIQEGDLVEVLLHGCQGYDAESNEDIMEEFLGCYGEHRIPKIKIEVNEQQCKKCTYLICVCKPVTFYTPKRNNS
tara:strand:- start:492 stop:773 length:282 start_codon:yes stop_codon:yes gene_type:complete